MQPKDLLQSWIDKARQITSDPQRTLQLLQSAKLKFQSARLPNLKDLKSDFMTGLGLTRAYVKGEYRQIPWSSILLIMGGLLYFLNPLDLIPDFIPVKGLLDDAAVLTYVFATIHGDLERFRQWQSQKNDGSTRRNESPDH